MKRYKVKGVKKTLATKSRRILITHIAIRLDYSYEIPFPTHSDGVIGIY